MATQFEDDPNARDDADDLNYVFDLRGVKSISDLDPTNPDLPAGKYVAFPRTILNKPFSFPSAVRLTFVISSGPCKGRQHKERLFLTESAKPRTILFAKRLGLIHESECEMSSVSKSWASAIGKEVVIEINEDNYVKTLRTPNRAGKMKVTGIWEVSDPLVADVIADIRKSQFSAYAGKPANKQREPADNFCFSRNFYLA